MAYVKYISQAFFDFQAVTLVTLASVFGGSLRVFLKVVSYFQGSVFGRWRFLSLRYKVDSKIEVLKVGIT